MDSAWHARVRTAFDAVCDAPEHERASAIDEACAGDARMRAELESLLAHDSAPPIDLDAASALLFSDLPGASPAHWLGDYELLEVIGEGGMGIVHRARQRSPRREVAIKIMRPRFVSAAMVRRFQREAEALGRLHHPGIAQIHEAGIAPSDAGAETPFFAMEFVRGLPLLAHASSRSLGMRDRVRLIISVCEAVDYAHRQGVIHRDLKPANILVEEIGSRAQPKVLDFGIARLSHEDGQIETLATGAGELLGTLAYMSPEQVSGDGARVDGRTDVYAIGAALFELLTGQPPHDLRGKSIPEAIRIVGRRSPARLGSVAPSLRGDLETIVARSLDPEASRRYATPGDLGRDLQRFLDDQPIDARPATTVYLLHKFARRNRALVGGGAAVFIALVAGIVATSIQAAAASAARARAEAQAAASREVSLFLHDVLTSVDPVQAIGREVTVVEALGQARSRLENLSSDAPAVQASLSRTIGLAYRALGEHASSVPLLREARRTLLATAGPDHPDTLEVSSELSLALTDMRQMEEAAALARDTRERAERVEGRESEVYVRATTSLGIASYWAGDHAGAEALERESLELHRTMHGAKDRRTLTAMSNLALTLTDLGKLDEAEALLLECAAAREALLGSTHPETLFAVANIGYLRNTQGRVEDARALHERVVRDGRDVLGPTHPQWLAWVRNLALAAFILDEPEEGARLLQDTREYLSINGADTEPGALHHLGLLATILLSQGEAERARPIVDESFTLAVAMFGPDHLETLRACTLYVEYYELIGDETQREAWAARLKGTRFDPADGE